MIMIAQGNFEQVDPLVVKPVWHTENRCSCGHADQILSPNRANGGKKAALRGPFRSPQNQPSIGEGANCRSGN